jgi:hypothetical protein
MILLGIKSINASGSSTDSYGYSSFSITASNVTIIKEGTKKELQEYVYKQRQLSMSAKPKMSKLQDRLDDEDESLSEKEYDSKFDKYKKDMYIDTFDKLLLIEGDVL